jgi:UDP-N-acetylmuramoyl-tripeptide--D-alanyl-D-alanine ligase
VVTTDSREIVPGGIFFAKPGEADDGHRYLTEIAAKGASLAIVEKVQENLGIPQILVSSSVTALSNLAEYVLDRVRAQGSIKVIGITGSNGKTSTKNLLAAILSDQGKVVAPKGSYNNQVGTPTTILRIEHDTDFLIVELGAAGRGSIDRLARLTRPDIGVLLKVGLAHVGAFGGIAETAAIKAELLPHIRAHTVLNFDDPNVMIQSPVTDVTTFGFNNGSDVQIANPSIDLNGTKCEMKLSEGIVLPMTLKVLGEHQLYNAAAALAVAKVLNLPLDESIKSLQRVEMAERWRMQLMRRADGVYFINDAYNASPDSMRAALQTLATLGRQGHRTIAILGEMAELGDMSTEAHDSIGRLVVRYNIDQLFVIGEAAKLIHMGAMQEGSWDGESIFLGGSEGAISQINDRLTPGDVVLIKSSNSANLRFLGDQLAEV